MMISPESSFAHLVSRHTLAVHDSLEGLQVLVGRCGVPASFELVRGHVRALTKRGGTRVVTTPLLTHARGPLGPGSGLERTTLDDFDSGVESGERLISSARC